MQQEITSLDQLDPNGTYTYADYFRWKLEETVELIKGKIFKMSPAPRRAHQRIVEKFHLLVGFHFESHSCEAFLSPTDVRLFAGDPERQTTVVQPDLGVVCDPNKVDDRGINGAPDLVIEVLSPGTSKKDYHEKFFIYEEAGVREYWLISPDGCYVDQFILQDGKYSRHRNFQRDDTLTSAIFPDLVIVLNKVWQK